MKKNNVYIGRPSKWGNPYTIGPDGDRTEVLAKYRTYAWTEFSARELKQLRGKTLVCWCKPLACHGDILIELVKELEG